MSITEAELSSAPGQPIRLVHSIAKDFEFPPLRHQYDVHALHLDTFLPALPYHSRMMNSKTVLNWILFLTILVFFPFNRIFAAARGGEISRLVKKVTASRVSKIPRMARASAERIHRAILRESTRQKVDPILVMAVIEQESQFNSSARGSQGEIGLMQVKPDTARWLVKTQRIRPRAGRSLQDPETNIAMGVAYLAHLKARFPKRKIYLAAYNSGPGKVRKQLRKRAVSQHYARGVLKKYQRYQGLLSSGRSA